MPKRRPHESIEQFAIRSAYEAGHFWGPTNPEGWAIRHDDLEKLTARDPVVIEALRSYAMADATRYTKHVLDHHGRAPDFDGEIGPAIQSMVDDPEGRCPIPDFAPPPNADFQFDDTALQQVVERMQVDSIMPAISSGNWPGCHGVGDFHCAIVRWDLTREPLHLELMFETILRDVQFAYAQQGVLFRFVDANMTDLLTGGLVVGSVNIEASFVERSDGWIGLAIVSNRERCDGHIWCRYLASYGRDKSPEELRADWGSLIRHELGHNCGLGHSNGGTMNPSLIRNLPRTWVESDPSTPKLRQRFGGEPVPIPGSDEPVPPKPPTDLQSQVDRLRIKDVVQDVTIQWLVDQVRGDKEAA